MTLDAFMELVNGGYITEVGKINYYKKHPEILEQKTICDLSMEGTICKYIPFEPGEPQTFVDEETGEEVTMTIVDLGPANDENVIVSITPKDEESDTIVNDVEDSTNDEIVVDDESTDNPLVDPEE